MGVLELANERIRNIPTLPAVALKIIQTTNNPTSSARDLEKIIKNDQAIAAKILQMANSPFYGLSGKVNSLNRAVTLLGFNTVRSLALSISIVDHFKGKSGSEYFNRGRFWEHSLGVAVLSKLLAERKPRIIQEEVYMAGLLHDIGVIVMDQFFQDEFSKILQLTFEKKMPFREAENEVAGRDHAKFGSIIVQGWKYPDFLVAAIENHHNPSYHGPFEDYCHCVYLANGFEYKFTEGYDLWSGEEIDLKVMSEFLTDSDEVEILSVKFEAEMERHREIIRLFQ